MIGNQTIDIQIQPATGDRVDAVARVVGPGDTDDHSFPLVVTGSVLATWGVPDGAEAQQASLTELVSEIAQVHGTSRAFPAEGYRFDTYNSENTIRDTVNKIRNFGFDLFLVNRAAGDEIAQIFGGALLSEIDRINRVFVEQTGLRLVQSLDYAFEASEATDDLSSPPSTKAEFLYRICVLSVIIDSFGIRGANENPDTPSLRALENWLAERLDRNRARTITEAFARVKDLRKQYPIHEHFEPGPQGQRQVRAEVLAANEFFGFKPHWDPAAMWKAVVDAFKQALESLEKVAADDRDADPAST